MLNIAVFVSGSGTNLQALIDSINSGYVNANIKLVISNNKDAYGLVRAKKSGIPAICETCEKTIMNILKDADIDLIVLAGYLKLMSKTLTDQYTNRIINIHPSLIPSFCGKGFYGLKVHEGVIAYGAKVSGATVHFVDEGADTGPIILQKSVEVSKEDTANSLQQKVLRLEHEMLPLAVKLYCDNKIQVIGRRVYIND